MSQLLPLSLGQRLLWALDRLRGESGALNCPSMCHVEGTIELGQLQNALNELVAMHSALRTTIVPGRSVRQQINSLSSPVSIRFEDLDRKDRDVLKNEFIKKELSTRIDPTVSPIRVSLLKLGTTSFLLIINVHHIVTDLISSHILIEDLAEILNRKIKLNSSSQNMEAPKVSWDNEAFCNWQLEQIQVEGFSRQQRYWFERLAGMSPIASPLKAERLDRNGSTGLIEVSIDKNVRARLDEIAQKTQSSSFVVLLAVLYSMAFEQAGEKDFSVASLFSSRTRPELRRTVGFLVNLLVLRIRLSDKPSFMDVVEQSRRAVLEGLNNADLPFQSLSPPPPRIKVRDNARIDDVVFHVVPNPIETVYGSESLRLNAIVPEVIGRFDLEIAIRPTQDEYIVRLSFNSSRLDENSAKKFVNDYVETAHRVANQPDKSMEHVYG